MDTLTITIKLDSDAIYQGGADEIATILSKVAVRSMNTPCGPNGAVGPIMDSNGNTVGNWRVS
jgi:hypothetical protein